MGLGFSALHITRELAAGGIVVDEIVAVEPDPDNFRLLLANLRTAWLANRSTALQAFAGSQHAFAEVQDSGNGAWGMRMGPFSETGTPVLPLAKIVGAAMANAPVVLKCDIEGGERQLFLNIRDWEHLIRYILLELHTEFLPHSGDIRLSRVVRFSLDDSRDYSRGSSGERRHCVLPAGARGATRPSADQPYYEACPSMTIAKTPSKSTSFAWAWSAGVWPSPWIC